MRLLWIILVGLVCIGLAACPTPEGENTEDVTSIGEQGQKPDFSADKDVAAEEPAGDEEVVAQGCEVCGAATIEECTCEKTEGEAVEGGEPEEGAEAVEGEETAEGGEGAEGEEPGTGEEPEVPVEETH